MDTLLKLRPLTTSDIDCASQICLAAFNQSVAHTVSADGIATFFKIASPDAFQARMHKDTFMLVAEHEGIVIGVAELREGHHISMLFVRPDQQQQGIGRALLHGLLNHVRSNTVTVSASLTSVPAYEKYGFQVTGEISETAGLIYQPMSLSVDRKDHNS